MVSDATPGPPAPTLSIVVPTYKESKNVPILFERITAALGVTPWVMIVVDERRLRRCHRRRSSA
jgi:hypothetical protein